MTTSQPSSGQVDIGFLDAEVGEASAQVRYSYWKRQEQWVMSEQTFRDGWADSDEIIGVTTEPLEDFPARAADWGGPVAVTTDAPDPAAIARALRPVLPTVVITVNGTRFDV